MSTVVCFGEMLWDLLPEGKKPGGAPMNVAFHLQNLGIQAPFISRVGRDDLGDDLLAFLSEKNMSLTYIQRDEFVPTGVVKVALNEKGEATYDIVSPAAWDHIDLTEEAMDIIGQADAFIYESLAARHAVSRNTLDALIKRAKLKVFDANLRPPFYSKIVVEFLLYASDIIKINHHELDEVCSWYAQLEGEEACMRYMKEKFKLQAVIVTRGENGAAFVGSDLQYLEHPGYKVEVADTVGSGDSFLAAFLSRWLVKRPVEECLEFACAVGATVARHHGACPAITYEDIEETRNMNNEKIGGLEN